MARRLERVLTEIPLHRVDVLCETAHLPGMEPNRLTRVPFLKICLDGSFGILRSKPATKGQTRANRSLPAVETIGPGQAVIFAANTFVTAVFPRESRFLRITFEADGLLVGLEHVHHLREKSTGSPAGSLDATWLEGVLHQPASGLLRDLLLQRGRRADHAVAALRCLLFEILALLGQVDLPRSGGMDDDAEVMRFLRDQCHLPINRESVARALGVSAGHLGRRVKSATGQSFQSYLAGLRFESAAWLLEQSRLPVEEVALRCGFTSANYFAQSFRRTFGVSPREWRRGLSRQPRS